MKPLLTFLTLFLMLGVNAYAACIQGNCTNGKGTYALNNEEKYVGDFQNNMSHGKGTQTWANGDKYVGEYKNNKMHGQGTYTFGIDGAKYIGEWKNGVQHGQGTLEWQNGNKHVGNFKNGKPSGQIIITTLNGDKYEEMWKDGLKVSSKVIVKDDVEKQKVQKSKNDTTKKTIDYSEDENKYLTFNFPDGRKYVGQSKNGKAHGQGTFSWANGNECSGEWKNDFIHRGTCFIDGDKYTGEFKNNEAIGKGKYVSKNGSIYEGDFEKDKFHGKGVFTYPDGKKYIGEFKEGVLHGFGLVIFLNGEVYNVKHENDKLISHSLVTGLVASPNGYLSTENSNLYSNRETILFYDNATKSMRECAGDVIAGTCTNYAPYKTSSYNNDSLFYNPATGAMQKCLSQVFGKCHNFAPQTFTRSIDQLYYNPRTKSMSTCLNANRQGKCLAFGISPSINRSALKNEYRGFQSQSKTNPYYFQVPETASDLIEQGLNMLGGGCTLGLNC